MDALRRHEAGGNGNADRQRTQEQESKKPSSSLQLSDPATHVSVTNPALVQVYVT
jgi:hypothetical protein